MAKQEGFIRFLSRHLVSLTFFDRSPARATEFFGAGRMMLVSGFVVSVRGVWLLITAGHVLEEIDAANQAFDPNLHEAVSHQESTDVPEGQVLQQLRKGYRLCERLIRPASVVVARKPDA